MTPEARFLRYVAIPTMSDEASETCPSTKKQLVLADLLLEELRALGLDARRDENGYVMASLAANSDLPFPKIGLVAHMDTSPDAPDAPIHPRAVEYTGGDILLHEDGTVLSPRDYPYLAKYEGHRLIVTDGKTLLGADDKAGIAAIVSAVADLIQSGRPHGEVKVAFTPDEEVGRGADLFDVAAFGADFAYTVDGGSEGELEYENFNAASALAEFYGVSIHPGAAKGKMKNAAAILAEFTALFPPYERPETTEGYEGFFHLIHLEGETEYAKCAYIIRDHDREKFEEKKARFAAYADRINEKYGKGTVKVTVKDSYYNMKEKITPCMEIVDRARRAMEKVGITPRVNPIRGGTDGARLSFMGLPCPNLCTGGENFHSRFEFLSVTSLSRITRMLVELLTELPE